MKFKITIVATAGSEVQRGLLLDALPVFLDDWVKGHVSNKTKMHALEEAECQCGQMAENSSPCPGCKGTGQVNRLIQIQEMRIVR